MKKFTVQISDKDLEYLNQKLVNTRLTNSTIENTWDKGVPASYLKK